jgi:hypothetical protein
MPSSNSVGTTVKAIVIGAGHHGLAAAAILGDACRLAVQADCAIRGPQRSPI